MLKLELFMLKLELFMLKLELFMHSKPPSAKIKFGQINAPYIKPCNLFQCKMS